MVVSSWEFSTLMATDDFFRARLDQTIDLAHPLAVLATRRPWSEIEAALAPAFAHKDRAGRQVEDANLFGTTMQWAGARPAWSSG